MIFLFLGVPAEWPIWLIDLFCTDDDEEDEDVEIARYDSDKEEEDVVSKTIRWADEVDEKGHRRHPSDEVNRTPTAFGLELD